MPVAMRGNPLSSVVAHSNMQQQQHARMHELRVRVFLWYTATAVTTSDAKFSKVGACVRWRDNYALKYKSQPCTVRLQRIFHDNSFHLSSRLHAAASAATCFSEMSPRLRLGDAIVPRGRRRLLAPRRTNAIARDSVPATNYFQCYSLTWPMPPDVHVPRHST